MNKILKETVKLACKNVRSGEVLIPRRNANTCKEPGPMLSEVAGLSKNVVQVPAHTVGFPEASKEATYKNPEYFCYHTASFFEAEVEMMKYRLPQPSNKAVKK